MKGYYESMDMLGAGADAMSSYLPLLSMFTSGGGDKDKAAKEAEAAKKAAEEARKKAAAKARRNLIIGLSLGGVGVGLLGLTTWALVRKRK